MSGNGANRVNGVNGNPAKHAFQVNFADEYNELQRVDTVYNNAEQRVLDTKLRNLDRAPPSNFSSQLPPSILAAAVVTDQAAATEQLSAQVKILQAQVAKQESSQLPPSILAAAVVTDQAAATEQLSAQVKILQAQVAKQAQQLDQMQEGHTQLTKLVQSVGTLSRLVLSAVNQLK
jgi:hypothetical protein